MISVVATKRELQGDARQRAREIPVNHVDEAIEGIEAALQAAEGDLKLWLEAAQAELSKRQAAPTRPAKRSRRA